MADYNISAYCGPTIPTPMQQMQTQIAELQSEVKRLREALEQIKWIAEGCDTELGAPIDKCWDIAHEALAQEVEK